MTNRVVFVVRKTDPEKMRRIASFARKCKTKTQCGTVESCPTFPQFHITAATRKMVILYIIKTALKKAKNSLDRDMQKRDNRKCCVTN